MKEQVTLTIDYGKHKLGTVFEVVKVNKDTTVCLNDRGKRIILANKYLSGKGEPVLELTRKQYDILYTQILEFHTDDVPFEDYEDIITEEYKDATGLELKIAAADVKFIHENIVRGTKVTIKGASKVVGTPAVDADMSSTEQEALRRILEGGGIDEAITVTSDTFEVPEDKPPELKENQIWLTDVTGGRLPDSEINHVINQYPLDHFPEDQRVHIPAVKETHHWDPNVLECLILSHELKEKALLTGLPGTGKSSSVSQFAAIIRQPYTRIGGRGDLESADIIGQIGVVAQKSASGELVSVTEFRAGILTQGIMQGHLVTIDEVMKIPSYIQMCMQHLYEKDGYLTCNDLPGSASDKIIRPPAEFMMVLTDNVKGTGDGSGKFAATQVQDTSTLDRISLNETVDYLKPTEEKDMLLRFYPTADKAVVVKLVKFANLVRNGYKAGEVALTLSPRGLLAILEMVGRGIPTTRAIQLAFLNKIADDAEQAAVTAMLKTVGLSSL